MLDRCHILIVEDEYMLAQDLRNQLEDVGAVVLGPEPSVGRAMARLEREPRIDAAILDVNLGGEKVFPVADALIERHVPLLFTTGYQEDVVKSRFPDAITCDKPYQSRNLLDALATMVRAGQQ